jgi:sulfite exporter TauE/SafE
MSSDLLLLVWTAITVALLHTATGPDHYLPFIALGKARHWSLARTIGWTMVCGCGHVWSSILLGLGGAALGWSFARVGWFESVRGGMAGWALLIFGLTYGVWGLIRAYQNRPHKHFDQQPGGNLYVFEHKHGEVINPQNRHKVTPWVLFVIFVLGPCEPMIPLLYVPAAQQSWRSMLLLIGVYTLFTLTAMVGMVLLGYYGVSLLKTEKLERYMHVMAGVTISICGAGMVFLAW